MRQLPNADVATHDDDSTETGSGQTKKAKLKQNWAFDTGRHPVSRPARYCRQHRGAGGVRGAAFTSDRHGQDV